MTSTEIREKFLKFFEGKGHKIIPSASLIPENDSTTLFTGSGMQPMVPYLLGEKHPLGTRVADSQKSFRTVDMDEVGDNRHTTFFEMLGNWSLGDYFKKEQLSWIFEFLTEELGLDPEKLYVTVFIGDEKNNIPKDTESAQIWKKLFESRNIEAKEVEIGDEKNERAVSMRNGRIFYYGSKNWWSRASAPENMPAGEPGGPDSEMFYDFGIPHNPKFGKECHPNCDCGRFVEIGNSVFMEYKKNTDGTFSKLPQQNVDFGGGLERMTMAVNNCPDVIEVNHRPILDYIEKISGKIYGKEEEETKAFRIIADHVKAAVFLITDGVSPSNTDRGYYVRRLIRRSVRYADLLGITKSMMMGIADPVAEMYLDVYPEVNQKIETVKKIIEEEETKFRKTLDKGLKEFEKGMDAFTLFSTYGFPLELTLELAKEKGIKTDEEDFREKFKKHQELSRAGLEQKFKGGLGGHSEMEIKYHTATHLLLAALRKVLGRGLPTGEAEIVQKGSNITAERLRFDFNWPEKLSSEQLKAVEDLVNQKIKENIPVEMLELPKEEAVKMVGALSFDLSKYGDVVKVYKIDSFSTELCGGPHVANTGDLASVSDPERAVGESKGSSKSPFKITKEEAVSAGTRRIKAVLL